MRRRTRCPAAASPPSRSRTPRGARHAARAALSRRDRDRLLRARLLLGGGAAFWGLDGVYTTAVGYMNGTTPNPTYEEVCGGRTGHAEAVLVAFDPAKVSYADLLKVFFEEHDPTQGMRQGNDVGTQYRSGIYFANDAQKATAEMARTPTTRRCAAPGTSRSRPRSSPPGPSTTPRTTTSSTCTRCRTATAAWPAPASPAASPPRPPSRRATPRRGRLASRAGDPLPRLLHRRQLRRHRHRRCASASAATGCGAGSCPSSPARSPASPTRRSPSPCWSSRSSCSARSASCGSAGSSSSASRVGLLAALLGWRKAPRDADAIAAPQVQTIALWIALGVASFTVAEWTFPSQLSLDQGMFGGDTTWYHMPFAARIAQEHSTIHLHFTDPLRLAAWFYPQSSELIHAAAIVLFKSDWLSPLINLFWLAIALLAAWCVGRPYKVGPATLVAAAIVLDSGVMIETQPGEGRNDIMGLAFLIAFAAFLINGHQRRAPDGGGGAGRAGARRAAARQGPADRGRDRRRPGGLGQAHLPDPGRGDRRSAWSSSAASGRRLTTAWVMGLSMLCGRRLLVRAGGDQDRRQPDPADRLRAAAPAAARPDAARPAAALRGRPLPDRADHLPPAGSSPSSTTRSARSSR